MSTRRVESFLLRVVVQESTCGDSDAWRGRIQHIGSGDERHFQRMEDVIDFIREQFSGSFARLTIDVEDRRAE
ncbi:MAG TPA: hypothetical protein VNL77_05605 [Roseiflexaceae bacterium]|nr:hypothetical protein [Roseiflexaceae bacterium]